jgi:cation transport ATPase
MNAENDKWNLNRPPTKWEHFYGSALSVLILLIMAVLLYASSIMLLSSNEITIDILVAFAVSALLFIGSGYLLLRVMFSKHRKPNDRAIIITGYVIGVASSLLLVLSVFGVGNVLFQISAGLTGLAGSTQIINRSKSSGNS